MVSLKANLHKHWLPTCINKVNKLKNVLVTHMTTRTYIWLYHWGMVESNIKPNTKKQEMENSPQRDDRSHNSKTDEYRQIICLYSIH